MLKRKLKSETIRQAVESILFVQGIDDLKAANVLLAPMAETYGDPRFDWSNQRRPVEFAKMLDPRAAAELTDEAVSEYELHLDRMMMDLDPVLYALRIETDLLQIQRTKLALYHQPPRSWRRARAH